jgi:hypothetical protein
MIEYILIFFSVIAILAGAATIVDYIYDKMNDEL